MIIVGKGGHARQCAEIIVNKFNWVEFVNDTDVDEYGGLVCIGFGSLDNPIRRQEVFDLYIGRVHPTPLIHSSAIVSSSVKFGRGVQVHAGAIIQNNAEIGDNCIINTGAIVSHDCMLGKNVHLTPGATLAGNVEIGDNSVIGMNATVYMGVKLPEDTVVLNGMNVKACKNGRLYYII